MLKNVKWNAVVKALLYLAAGIFLFAAGNRFEPYLAVLMGVIAAVAGAAMIVFYMFLDVKEALFRNDFLEGLCLILVGTIVILNRVQFQQMVPVILAACILISSFSKVQDEVDAKRLGYQNHSTYLVFAIIGLIIGVVLLLNLLKAEYMLWVAAAGFIYCGVSDLISALYLSKKFRDFVDNGVQPDKDTPEYQDAFDPSKPAQSDNPFAADQEPDALFRAEEKSPAEPVSEPTMDDLKDALEEKKEAPEER